MGFLEETADRILKEGIPLSEEDLKRHLKEIHQNTLRKFLSFQNVRDFAIQSIDILNFIFRQSTARLHPFFRRGVSAIPRYPCQIPDGETAFAATCRAVP